MGPWRLESLWNPCVVLILLVQGRRVDPRKPAAETLQNQGTTVKNVRQTAKQNGPVV